MLGLLIGAGCDAEPRPDAPSAAATSPGGTSAVVAIAAAAVDELEFPLELEPAADDFVPPPRKLLLSGSALRKRFGLRFYRIGSYCDAAHCKPGALPDGADSLIAADCAKQLTLVMVREISPSVLERSFSEALSANDPQQKFAAESKRLLDHMLSAPMHEGQQVTLRHHPRRGMSCQVGNGRPLHVDSVEFARIVWSVYMGPKGVSPELRTGLASRLER